MPSENCWKPNLRQPPLSFHAGKQAALGPHRHTPSKRGLAGAPLCKDPILETPALLTGAGPDFPHTPSLLLSSSAPRGDKMDAEAQAPNKEQAWLPVQPSRPASLGSCGLSCPVQPLPQHSSFPLQPSLLKLVIFRVSLETYPETTVIKRT